MKTITPSEALLDSWMRQNRIVASAASRIDESNRNAKPSEDGWPLYQHLAHIHKVRLFWLGRVSPSLAETLGDSFVDGWTTPIDDLDEIKSLLAQSGEAVGVAVKEALEKEVGPVGGYDHPVMFLQHLIWHEGWHVGLIFLALRLAGQEPPEEWEYANVWSQWVTE